MCDITQAEWQQKNEALTFTVQSNRFLRGMVRGLVGTLLIVGTGKRSVSDFEKIISAKDRRVAGPQDPAQGLFLVEVGYDESFIRKFPA